MRGVIAVSLLLLSAPAFGLALNADLKLTPENPALEGKQAVLRVYKGDNLEVHLKTISIATDDIAGRAVAVNFGLIKGLYEPKKNPYAGEITALVKCDSKFSTKEFEVPCPSGVTNAIAGGAGGRHTFGMCTKQDIREVGAFFSCYDADKKELIEVRIFIPYSSHQPWANQLEKVVGLAGRVLR